MDPTQNYHIELEDIIPEYYTQNKYVRSVFLRRLDIAATYLHKIKARKILDAGCGDGLFANRLKNKEHFEEIIGIDLNVHVEKLNKQYKNIIFKRMDLHRMPFRNEFDAVACLDVLEHFENVEPILKEIRKSLKKGGYLVVSGPVEGIAYKLGRFLTKGTFSMETGPGAGKHYHNIKELHKIISRKFMFVKKERIFFLWNHLFDVNLYQKK